jgi:cyanophycin synthetase
MANISSLLIIEEAQKRGWRYEFVNEDHSSLVYIQPRDKEAKLFKSSVTVRDSALGYRVTDDKYLTCLVLQTVGLPTPPAAVATTAQDIVNFCSVNGVSVVKPAAEDHGYGVTINVDEASAARALQTAKEATGEGRIIVQKMLHGNDHRFLVVGDAVFVARRRAPIIVGDGIHTIAELVEQLNADPMRGDAHDKPLTKVFLEDVLVYTKMSAPDVPEEGQEVQLLGTANLSTGGWAEDLTDTAHQSLKDIALDATKHLGLCVCGVDIICDDVTKSADEQEVGIIEMNVSPGIRMHHFPSKGASHNVAGAILDAVFGEGMQHGS